MFRRELYFWISLICVSNALLRYIVFAFKIYDPYGAVFSGFNLSSIIWFALIWALYLLFPTRSQMCTRLDYIFAALSLIFALLPMEHVGWIGVGIAGIAMWVRSDGDVKQRTAGKLLAAVTVPQLWSKIVFSILSKYIIVFDATLVSQITRTSRIGNLVAIPDGSGYLLIEGPCSSFANISLAYLGWVMALMYFGLRRSTRMYLYFLFIVLQIVIVNTIRIALIGYFPRQYELIHGEVGSTIIGWVYVIVIFGTCAWAARTAPQDSSDPRRVDANTGVLNWT